MSNSLLRDTLELAVPLQILEIKSRQGPTKHDYAKATALAGDLAEKGDILLFGGKKGEAAEMFNRLAFSIAVLSFLPGGITLFGNTWRSGDVEAS